MNGAPSGRATVRPARVTVTYNRRMDTDLRLPRPLPVEAVVHLTNVADTLQLVADLGSGDVALAVEDGGQLRVVADARPMTAVAAIVASRVGQLLKRGDEPEAYSALETGSAVTGTRRRTTRGISYLTSARPVGPAGAPYGVVLRDVAQQSRRRPEDGSRVHVACRAGL